MTKRLLLLLLALSTLLIVATVQFKDDFLFAVGLSHSSKIEDNSINEVAAANNKTIQQNQQSENQTFDESELYCYIDDDEADPPHVLADGKLIELEDGMDLSGKLIEGDITGYRKIYHNINFSKCRFKNVAIKGVAFIDTTFEGAIFEGWGIRGLNFVGKNINLTNVNFLPIDSPINDAVRNFDRLYCGWYLHGSRRKSWIFAIDDYTDEDLLTQTIPYKLKHMDTISFNCKNSKEKDYSNFWFINNGYAPHNPKSCYKDAWFKDNNMSYLTKEQFISTKNYQERVFVGIKFSNFNMSSSNPIIITFLENLDLSTAIFVNCTFGSSMVDTNIQDAVFSNCIFCTQTNLTIEQIKSTWNYKHNRMDLIKLPPDLQKYFDEEKKEKE